MHLQTKLEPDDLRTWKNTSETKLHITTSYSGWAKSFILKDNRDFGELPISEYLLENSNAKETFKSIELSEVQNYQTQLQTRTASRQTEEESEAEELLLSAKGDNFSKIMALDYDEKENKSKL